jgi:regulator of ribonuclease activity A
MTFKTADLCDAHSEKIQSAEPTFGDFGGNLAFHGQISTVKCFEDNPLVRAAFEAPGEGLVLAIDGGGCLRCTLIGDQIAALAKRTAGRVRSLMAVYLTPPMLPELRLD